MQPTVSLYAAAVLLPGRVLQVDLRRRADWADTEAEMKTPPPELVSLHPSGGLQVRIELRPIDIIWVNDELVQVRMVQETS